MTGMVIEKTYQYQKDYFMLRSIHHSLSLLTDCFIKTSFNSLLKNVVFILVTFFCSNFSLSQTHNKEVIVKSILKDLRTAINMSDSSIISKIGEDKFNQWLDSVIVVDIPYDNGCQGVHRPCDPIPRKTSDKDRLKVTYYFTIPVFGNYSGSNYTYTGEDGEIALEDHYILPDCVNQPYKCSFLSADSLFARAKNLLLIADTNEIRSSISYLHSGSFAYLFETGRNTLILSANTGKVLEYTYFGPSSSNDCSVIQKCTLNDTWVVNAKNFLGINDDFTLISDSTSQNPGRICKWRFTSDTSFLELNGKDGVILNYINYKESMEN